MSEGDSKKQPFVLYVEDDEPVRRRVSQALSRRFLVRAVGTIRDAREVLADEACAAMLVDVGLPDGSGLDFVATARSSGYDQPVAIYTGNAADDVIERTLALGATYFEKPVPTSVVDAWLRDALRRRAHGASVIAAALADLRDRFELTPREQEIVEVSTMGVLRSGLAVRLGIAEGTLKKHVNALLAKTGAESLPSLVNGILRSATNADSN